MTKQQYEKHEDEFLKFERVENKLSERHDVHAFLMLDKLFPGKKSMISCAEHDEIWLCVDPEELAKIATEEQIIELMRCGVRYDSNGSLAMFV